MSTFDWLPMEQRFFALSIDLLCIAGYDGYFKRLNPAWERTLGYTIEELTAAPFIDFVHPDDRAATLAEAEKLTTGVDTLAFENRYRHRDGSFRWLRWSATMYAAEELFYAVARDVTAQKEAEAERRRQAADLRAYARELEAHNAELDAFTHTVAHDLKTPLTTISLYAQLMQRHLRDDDEARQRLGIVRRAGGQMATIIDELLLLAQVRKTDVRLAPLNMKGVLTQAMERLSTNITQKQARIEQPGEWLRALGYGPWIVEVWVNYLSNAMKYGGDPPRIAVGATPAENDHIRFWVRDNGPGISQDDQATLFTPFTQLRQLHKDGNGLGLSIVRRIIEKCQGEVGVDSAPGAGSTFWFSLPSAV